MEALYCEIDPYFIKETYFLDDQKFSLTYNV